MAFLVLPTAAPSLNSTSFQTQKAELRLGMQIHTDCCCCALDASSRRNNVFRKTWPRRCITRKRASCSIRPNFQRLSIAASSATIANKERGFPFSHDELTSLQPPTANFYLPRLHCSLPSKIHPRYSTVKDVVDRWIVSTATTCTGIESDSVVHWEVPLAMCLGNPEASLSRLLIVTKLMVWMGLADDLLDVAAAGDEIARIRAANISTAISSVLEGDIQRSSANMRLDMTAEIFVDLWQQLVCDMPGPQKQRLKQTMRDYFRISQTMTWLREAECLPSIANYIQLRRVSGGVYPTFLLQEFALGIEKDEEAEQSSLLRQLEDVAADHIVWVNDLFSMRKEGDVYNLPTLLSIHEGCSLRDAIHKACHMILAKEKEFTKLRNGFTSSEMAERTGLLHYVDSMAYFMSANVKWSYVTGRYMQSHSPNSCSSCAPAAAVAVS